MESVGSPLLWGGFVAAVLAMLALDLGVFHRQAHEVRLREALVWSGVWVALALLFAVFVGWRFGEQPALEYLTGYVIEKSLSVDNIFVFVVIFSALRVPPRLQHRVLFWGILSALVLRAGMIVAGAALLARFHWIIYVFGGLLLLTGLKLLWQQGKEERPLEGGLLGVVRRVLPTTRDFHGASFLAREGGRWMATPLLLALVLVEASDVVFALDSIPAIFAVTRDPFLVFTSNIFAILGLRSLFFVLAGMVERFTYLKVGLAAVLLFVGAKMVLVDVVHLPPAVSLSVICALLGGSVAASLWRTRRVEASVQQAPGEG